nr:hypothetical protein BaRGS_005661 [Batillaria attramentaria]KAG5707026.1 hypothetical protein BaRGS_019631 [Batillaria attramentaria]
MRCFLDTRNIPTSTCKEKHDLIDLLLMHFCLESTSALNEQQEHDRLVGELAPESRPGIQRATIDDVQSQEDVENLTVRQLKEILVNNFVDYKGCVEKHELVDRVKRLWVETQANKERGVAFTSGVAPEACGH